MRSIKPHVPFMHIFEYTTFFSSSVFYRTALRPWFRGDPLILATSRQKLGYLVTGKVSKCTAMSNL